MVAGPAATATIRARGRSRGRRGPRQPRDRRSGRPGVARRRAGRGGPAACSTASPTPRPHPSPKSPTNRLRSQTSSRSFPSPLRAHLRLEAGEAEHRQVTAAFLKFTGVEALLVQGGPQALSESLSSLGALVGDTTSELGVTWLESDIDVDGGKIYLAAGAPSSTGADEERMLRALRDDPRRRLFADAAGRCQPRPGVRRRHRRQRRGGPMPSWATPSTSRPGSQRAPSQGRSSPPPRCSNARRPASRRSRSPSSSRARSGRSPPTASASSPAWPRRSARSELPIVGRETELAALRAAVAAARLRQGQVAELVGRARDRQVAARRGAQDDGGRLHAARRALRPVRDVRPLLRRFARCCGRWRESRSGERGRGRRAPEALGRRP